VDHAPQRGLLRPLFYLKGVVSQQLRSMMAPGAEHSTREIIYALQILYGSKYCKFATKKKVLGKGNCQIALPPYVTVLGTVQGSKQTMARCLLVVAVRPMSTLRCSSS